MKKLIVSLLLACVAGVVACGGAGPSSESGVTAISNAEVQQLAGGDWLVRGSTPTGPVEFRADEVLYEHAAGAPARGAVHTAVEPMMASSSSSSGAGSGSGTPKCQCIYEPCNPKYPLAGLCLLCTCWYSSSAE